MYKQKLNCVVIMGDTSHIPIAYTTSSLTFGCMHGTPAYYAVLMIMYNQASEASQESPSGSMTEGGTMASGEEKMTTATGNVFMEAIEMTAAGVV